MYGNIHTHGSNGNDAKDNTATAATTMTTIDRSIRRSASIPPRTPIPLGAYVNTMASLALLVVKLTAKPALQSYKYNSNVNA